MHNEENPPEGGPDQQANPQTNVEISEPSRRKTILIISVVVVLMIAAAGGFYLWHKNDNKKAADLKTKNYSSTPATKKEPATYQGQLLTFVKKDASGLIVTDTQQKIIAKVDMPEGKSSLGVLANNGQAVLIEARNDSHGRDKNPKLYLVGAGGDVQELGQATASDVGGISNNGEYLDNNNNLIYESCSSAACSLLSLDLEKGVTKSIISAPAAQVTVEGASSIDPIGVNGGIAYVIVYPPNAGIGAGGELEKVNLSDGKAQKLLAIPGKSLNTPQLSGDYKKLVYALPPAGAQANIINIQSDDLETVDISGHAPIFYMSPGGTKAAFISDESAFDASNVSLGYIDLEDGKSINLKDYGTPNTNDLTLRGWQSDQVLDYWYSRTTTPRDFTNGSILYYDWNFSTQAQEEEMSPAGYTLVSPDPFLNAGFLDASGN